LPTRYAAALREDPDVVLIGEMRDLETIESALRIAETGPLDLRDAAYETPPPPPSPVLLMCSQRTSSRQIRAQLSMVLEGILCQALVPRSDNRGR